MVSFRPLLLTALLSSLGPVLAQEATAPTLLRPNPDEASLPSHQDGPARIVANARRSVVHVVVEVDGPRGAFPIVRSSSGVLVGKQGFVLTWRHLVREAEGATDKKVFVQLDDAQNTRLLASIEKVDAASGLALLRVTLPPDGLQPAALGADHAQLGEPVLVLARPLGKEMLAFAGVASSSNAAVTVGDATLAPSSVFLTDARSDERCDGAPAFDAEGRLLGLYAADHVQRDVADPKLEDLQRPSFGVLADAATMRKAFAKELGAEPAAAHQHAHANAALRAANSVVTVFAGDGDFPVATGTDPGGVMRVRGLGSGVVVSKNGLVVCNAHVAKAGSPRIRTADGKVLPAKVLATGGNTNLALLQVELGNGATLVPAVCNADDDAIVGETVLAVGRPYAAAVVTRGVVSALRDREGGRIQADANLGNQNGGGAVVDVEGFLLGIGDAGAMDPIEMQFAMRGDRVSTETNLSTFVGIARVRRVFREQFEELAGKDEPIREPGSSIARLRARKDSLARMVEKHAGAMLNVYVAKSVTEIDEDDPFASMKEPVFQPISLGSGVIVDPSGLALSNWHVVDDATRPDGSMVADHQVTVRAFGGKEYKARVLSISREDDLSLLQLELAPGETVPFVELGSSEALALGEPVAAIGNPHGRANTVTSGIVSAEDQAIQVKGRFEKLGPLVETDAAINGGNSGGALLDRNGRLVGINSAGGGTFNNKGYAIEVDHVRKQVLGLLLQAYKLRSPDLGLRVVDEDGKVLVLDCDPRGPAARAGVQSGDRIVSLDGDAVVWSPGFALRLCRTTPGVDVELALERKGEAKTVRVPPLAPEVWAVVRQSSLLVRDFPLAEDEERVQKAAIGLHRATTGDTAGEPQTIPAAFVRVEQHFPGLQKDGVDVAVGDLVLGVELRTESGDPVVQRIESVTALRDLFNDRLLGTYEGQTWKVWIARGAEVKPVEWTAKRLFW